MSYRFIYTLIVLLGLLLAALGAFFYQQYSVINEQQAMLLEDSQYQKSLQDKIASLQNKEAKISALHQELQKTKSIAEQRLDKLQVYTDIYSETLVSLKKLHKDACQTLKRKCPEIDKEQIISPDEAILWMSNARTDFEELQGLVEKFDRRKYAAEEQEYTIKQLQQRIANADRKIAASLESLKNKELAIIALAKKIKDATGITLPLKKYFFD